MSFLRPSKAEPKPPTASTRLTPLPFPGRQPRDSSGKNNLRLRRNNRLKSRIFFCDDSDMSRIPQPKPDSDDVSTRAIGSGSPSGEDGDLARQWRQLFEEVAGGLRAFLRNRLRQESDVDDCLQVVLVKMLAVGSGGGSGRSASLAVSGRRERGGSNVAKRGVQDNACFNSTVPIQPTPMTRSTKSS